MIEIIMLCAVLLGAVALTKLCLSTMLWFLGKNDK